MQCPAYQEKQVDVVNPNTTNSISLSYEKGLAWTTSCLWVPTMNERRTLYKSEDY